MLVFPSRRFGFKLSKNCKQSLPSGWEPWRQTPQSGWKRWLRWLSAPWNNITESGPQVLNASWSPQNPFLQPHFSANSIRQMSGSWPSLADLCFKLPDRFVTLFGDQHSTATEQGECVYKLNITNHPPALPAPRTAVLRACREAINHQPSTLRSVTGCELCPEHSNSRINHSDLHRVLNMCLQQHPQGFPHPKIPRPVVFQNTESQAIKFLFRRLNQQPDFQE